MLYHLDKIINSKKLSFLFVFVISSLVIFHRLDEATLLFDDCYYAIKVREMVKTKNYFVPTYNYEPDFQDAKPILHYWGLIVSGKVFGFHNYSMRIYAGLSGLISILLLFMFVSKYWGQQIGFMSSIILLLTQQFMRHSRTAQPDIPFTLFFTLALICFWTARSEKKDVLFYFMGLFSGFAYLTRNAPGLFVYIIIFAYIFLAREFRVFKNLNFYGGILTTFLVSFPWVYYMYLKYNSFFLEPFFGIVLRLGLRDGRIDTPWYLIIGRIIETYWPWLPFLVIGFYKKTAELIKNKINSEEEKITLFILLWVTIPFLIFQSAKVKGTQYIMPIYIPAAIICATVFNGYKETIKKQILRWMSALAFAFSIVYLIFPLAPKTLDIGHYGDLMKIIPTIRKIESDTIISYHRDYWYFANGVGFYADKKIIGMTDEEIVNLIDKNVVQNYFLVKKEDMTNKLLQLKKDRIKVIDFTDKFIFFTNKK